MSAAAAVCGGHTRCYACRCTRRSTRKWAGRSTKCTWLMTIGSHASWGRGVSTAMGVSYTWRCSRITAMGVSYASRSTRAVAAGCFEAAGAWWLGEGGVIVHGVDGEAGEVLWGSVCVCFMCTSQSLECLSHCV